MFDAGLPAPPVRLAFALLAHGSPEDVGRLVHILTAQGHLVAVHYDLGSPGGDFARLQRRFAGDEKVRFAQRVTVRWGEWSVVQGTLNCLDEIATSGWQPDYVYHLSGADYPIKPDAQLLGFLARHQGDEYIEAVPAETHDWVRTGPQCERYRQHWWFNWRTQKRRTELAHRLQRRLGVRRRFPHGLVPHIGSQWWVLTWPTLQAIRQLAQEPDIRRFFRTTLVPDELFFQTLARHVAAPGRITNHTLTLYQFSDYGVPVVYFADHFGHLLRQNFFFARKISGRCQRLRDQLDPIWSSKAQRLPFTDGEVGLPSSAYEDWRLAFRDGPPGRPVAGRSQGRWYEDHKRLTRSFFAVLGTSRTELRLVQTSLSATARVVCHGEIFHRRRIEFARGAGVFAGYAADDMPLRDLSAPNFVADLIGAERRLSGFLLRRGQGWHVAELAFDRPHVRVIVVEGDPLIAFCETLLNDELSLYRLRSVPPVTAALCFRRFIADYQLHRSALARHWDKASRSKPAGWLVRIDLRSKDWSSRLAACLDLPAEDCKPGEVAPALVGFAELRETALELLRLGGIASAALAQLAEPACDLPLVVELV